MRLVPLSVIVVGSDEEEELLLIGRGTRMLVNVIMGIDASSFCLPRPRTYFAVVVVCCRRFRCRRRRRLFCLVVTANETVDKICRCQGCDGSVRCGMESLLLARRHHHPARGFDFVVCLVWLGSESVAHGRQTILLSFATNE